MNSYRNLALLTLASILGFWSGEAALDTFVFSRGPYLDDFFRPGIHELVLRLPVVLLLVGVGALLATDLWKRQRALRRSATRRRLLEVRSRIAQVFLTRHGQDLYQGTVECLCVTVGARSGFLGVFDESGNLEVMALQCGDLDPGGKQMKPPHILEPDLLAADIRSALADRRAVIGGPQNTLCGMEATSLLAVPILGPDSPMGMIVLARHSGAFGEADAYLVEALAAYLAPLINSLVVAHIRELQVIQAQKMEALGALTGGISHDFNNILQAIMGFTTMAREEADPGSTLAGDLDKVLRAAERGRDLVQRVQMVRHAENQEHRPVALQAVLEDTIPLLRRSIPTTISITADVDSHCPEVLADPAQIQQVLLNLSTNAYHAMENSGGSMKISLGFTPADRLPPTVPDALQDHDLVVIEISDTGSGMDQDTMNRLFDPFYTTKEVGKGTGLGLSVVHGIVSAHGGAVTVDSEPGRGTAVSVYLPALESKPSRSPGSDIPAPSKGRILLIDDEMDIVQIAKAFLENQGHTVTPFTDGQAALEAFRRDPTAFDLVISDLSMPNLTGEQLAGMISSERRDLPILLITGYADRQEDFGRAIPGVRGLIQKPFTSQVLAKAAARALADRSHPLREQSWPEF